MDKNLCISFTKPDMISAEAAPQVRIHADRLDDSSLEKYLDTNSEKHIYIDTSDECLTKNIEHMRKLQELKKYDNWTLQIPVKEIIKQDKTGPIVDRTKFQAIKDCCNSYMFTDLIGQWEVLQFIISLEPSEVYITNILGFCIPDVENELKNHKIGIRVYANWAQSAWDNGPGLTKFFIRPEDVDCYAEHCSGIEFMGDANIQEVMFDVYARGYWYGDLAEIIIGLDEHVDSRRLPHEFGEWRLGCKKRCICGKKCNLCMVMKGFSERLQTTETVITPKVKMKEEVENYKNF